MLSNAASQEFKYLQLRGELAQRMVTQARLAQAARLHPVTVSDLLRGAEKPGELAQFKLRQGLEQLGIDPSVAFGPAEQES